MNVTNALDTTIYVDALDSQFRKHLPVCLPEGTVIKCNGKLIDSVASEFYLKQLRLSEEQAARVARAKLMTIVISGEAQS